MHVLALVCFNFFAIGDNVLAFRIHSKEYLALHNLALQYGLSTKSICVVSRLIYVCGSVITHIPVFLLSGLSPFNIQFQKQGQVRGHRALAKWLQMQTDNSIMMSVITSNGYPRTSDFCINELLVI